MHLNNLNAPVLNVLRFITSNDETGGHVARVAETRNQHKFGHETCAENTTGRPKCSGSVIVRVGVCRLHSYDQDWDK